MCSGCGKAMSSDLVPEVEEASLCCECGKGSARQVKRCIEVGHTFLLGESSSLKVKG